MTAKEIIAYMESLQNEEQRRILMGFFKTGPGEYGEGDEFLGLKVPQTREVVKNVWKDYPLSEVPELLMSKWHEVRLCGLLILVAKFEKLTKRAAARTPLECTEKTNDKGTPLECTEKTNNKDTPLECTEKTNDKDAPLECTEKTNNKDMPLECTEKTNDKGTPLECTEKTNNKDTPLECTEAIRGRDEILMMYLQYAERANNWDLVDLSVHKILGHWLLLPTHLGNSHYSKELRNQGIIPIFPDSLDDKLLKISVLDSLAQSPCLWKQRMSIVCSWKTSQMGDPSWCLRYAEIHLHHPHDLMHKAVGWMLREMGKRCSMDLLRDFLRQHAHEMPRTMLRYAIEKMSEQERQEWMRKPSFAAEPRSTLANSRRGECQR